MIRFLARRVITALVLLLILSVLMYGLASFSMDPLDDLRQDPSPEKPAKMAARIDMLQLDQHWLVRYWHWLVNFVQGDLGMAWRSQQPVSKLLPGAVATSVQLVITATILALLLGVTVGVISALRQYTTFDFVITFVSFVLFSLPVFWVAVLLKQFLAIDLNNYLADPHIKWPLVIGLSVVSGLFWLGALGGDLRKRAITFAVGFGAVFAALVFMMGTGWLDKPVLGPIGIALVGVAVALAVSVLFAGWHNKRALYSALTTAVVGVIIYFPLSNFFQNYVVVGWYMVPLLVIALVIAAVIGFAFGGPDRGVSIRGALVVALVMSFAVWGDQVMHAYPGYYENVVGGRPVPTFGTVTPNLGEVDYWTAQLDKYMHLVLPTISLVLISFAGYTRYQRGAMLEVLNQDYIRTARSKGLPERVVIVRHALRNALLPLASIVPPDFIGMIGGALLTERIFSWQGMGNLFVSSLGGSEIDPVMAYVMITGALAMVANVLADLLYAVLDPRIRVNA